MKKSHIDTGERGEDFAVSYLLEHNYSILSRNFRYKRSEIDIIARKENLLVFVEVKTRRNYKFGFPEASVDSHKMEMIHMGAEAYMEEIKWRNDIRFDVIAILYGNTPEIKHFKDAF